MWPNPRETADLVTLTEEIFNGELHFLCSKSFVFPELLEDFRKQPPKVVYKKKVFLEISQNSQKNTCARISFLIKLQVFSCEFCEISKSTIFTEHLRMSASGFHTKSCHCHHYFIANIEAISS